MMKCAKRQKCEHVAFDGIYLKMNYQEYTDTGAMGSGMFTCCDCGLTLSQIFDMQEQENKRLREALDFVNTQIMCAQGRLGGARSKIKEALEANKP